MCTRAGWTYPRLVRYFITRGLLLLALQFIVEDPVWNLSYFTVHNDASGKTEFSYSWFFGTRPVDSLSLSLLSLSLSLSLSLFNVFPPIGILQALGLVMIFAGLLLTFQLWLNDFLVSQKKQIRLRLPSGPFCACCLPFCPPSALSTSWS